MKSSTKKPYTSPVMIDLSLEGITGFGAGTCNTGPNFGEPVCTPGKGAISTCSLMGMGVTTACTTGGFPYESGTICSGQGSSAAACYSNGSVANQGMSRCITSGLSAIHSTSASCYMNGASDSSLCWAGTTYTPAPPYS